MLDNFVSVILPIYNEEACIEDVVRELDAALGEQVRRYEILAVDDGSTDTTRTILQRLQDEIPQIRILQHVQNAGQSNAFRTGFVAAKGDCVVTMDADGQNDPSDIHTLVEKLTNCDLCCGFRANRKDTLSKRWGSKLANKVRRGILHDGIIDTGCSLKAFKCELAIKLPMFDGMHRFLPALSLMYGARIEQVPVNHRARSAGVSKYTNAGRLKRTIWDLWAVRWMQRRVRPCTVQELAPAGDGSGH